MTENRNFNFPFEPYHVQYNFMNSLYTILEKSEIGILESPTGTGKTLSLLCGSLKWLQDHEQQMKENLNKNIQEFEDRIRRLEDELKTADDWITLQYKIAELKKELYEIKDEVKSGVEYEEMIEKMKGLQVVKKKKQTHFARKFESKSFKDENMPKHEESVEEAEDKQFALNEESDGEINVEDEDETDKIKYKGVKIFYSSRTHSQLNQVLHEIKKTSYAKDLRVVTLASRQIYCLNSHVKQLNSNELINEKCIDLQKLKSVTKSIPLGAGIDGNPKKRRKVAEKVSNCEYYSRERFNEFKNENLCEIRDIEDIMKLGKKNKTCPYYSAKKGIEDAQLVLLPYQMLLNEKIRQQFGIDLKRNIVIIDEAHNLLDTLCDMHSSIISLEQLELGFKQLQGYFNKYMNQMKPKNIVEFKKLIFILRRLIRFFDKTNFPTITKGAGSYRIFTTVEMMCQCEFGNFNVNEILIFCENTRIADKVTGFAKWWYQKYPNGIDVILEEKPKISSRLELLKNLKQRQEENNKKVKKKKMVISDPENVESQKATAPEQTVIHIRPILRFLNSLTEKLEAGRILVNFDEANRKNCYMKYILMKPNEYFTSILKESKSLVLAGGTMQPTNEIINMLLHDHKFRVREYSFDHVVTKDACLPLIIKKGPKGEPFLFNYGNRSNPKLFAELATILLNVSSLVPHGIVCFFVSYDYLNEFHSYLEKSTILEQIERKKKVFVEPKNRDHVEKVLGKYRLSNEGDSMGALLFSVMGGKLSEGLNFSDHLGRCVIVVGMPYPNKNSPELLEKMKNFNLKFGNNAGSLYYENLCMKAVNQSIGRAIRHINDYASILLLDERYAREDILNKLPKWIREATRIPVSYGQGQMYLAQFFAKKKKN